MVITNGSNYGRRRLWLSAQSGMLLDNPQYELYRAGNGNPYEDYVGITNVNWNSELIWTDRYNECNILMQNVHKSAGE